MDISSNSQHEKYAIGLDIGGTKIAGGVVALATGRIIGKRVIPTRPERGGEPVLGDVLVLAEELQAEAKRRGLCVIGIGAGAPELVDLQGSVTSSHTLAWAGAPVQARLGELMPAVVESDVRAAALAEAHFGAGQAFRLFVYVTVGTGISCCLVQDGRPFAGARGNAIVMASSPLTTVCTGCGAKLQPVLEEIASGPALVARFNRRARNAPCSRAEEVLAAAEAGDAIAAEVVRSAGEAFGVSVGWLINVLDPEAVVVGGGLGSASGLYWSSFVASTREHIWAEANRDTPILHAERGADAGVIGAALALVHAKGSGSEQRCPRKEVKTYQP